MHLIDSFRQGGSESQALSLYLEMKSSGRFDVELSCLDRSGPLLMKLPPDERERVPEFKLNSFHDANMALQLYRFARKLRDLKVDVLHTHDFYTNIFGAAGAALAGVPIRIASRREEPKRARIKRFAERLAYKMSTAVIANCDLIREGLIGEGVPARKVIPVYNSVAVGLFDQMGEQHTTQAAGGRVVTLVANLRPVKDHATFLRAVRRVIEGSGDATFVLAGEGELESSLRDLACRLGIERHVRLIGRCDDVPSLLQRSDICVLSSISEGFSNAVLEYMAAGKPVVSTKAGGTAEAVIDGYNGFLVDPGDDVEMAERIVMLLDHPGLAVEMGERGRRLAAEKFSRRRQLETIEQLYERLLAHRPATTVERGARLSEG